MNEIIWITGGSSGIGFALGMRLAALGHAVAISGRDESKLANAARLIHERTKESLFWIKCDVTSEREIAHAHQLIVEHFAGDISMLIISAGVSPFPSFSETSVEEFDTVIRTNLIGAFLVAKAVLPAMYHANRGAVVSMLSIASEKAFKGGAAYVASKFALRGFTDSLREEARKHNVRVIGVLPGATGTELWDEASRKEFHDRMMQPEDIAEIILAALKTPERALVEEIRIRPIGGDL